MIIKKVTATSDDYRDFLGIYFNDDQKMWLIDGDPEDNNLSRNFADTYSILQMLEEVYNLGKNGVEVQFKEEEVEWSEL